MNRTQKGACFTLGMAVLLLAFMGVVHASMFAAGDRLAGTDRVKSWIVLFTVAAVALVRRKQSPAEPESDERDDAIKKNAVLGCSCQCLFLLIPGRVAAQ